MKKLLWGFIGVVAVVAVVGGAKGVDQAERGFAGSQSAQLEAFKTVKACDDGTSIGELIEQYALPSPQWMDGETQMHGPVVGFIADFPSKKPNESISVGMQANYTLSAMKQGVFQFQPVAMEMANSGGQVHNVPGHQVWIYLKQVCKAVFANAQSQ